jgi:hypothetical protein
MGQNTKRLTSVKVEQQLFDKFKEECVKTKFSFQKLADRSIYLYITDQEFRKRIEEQINIKL